MKNKEQFLNDLTYLLDQANELLNKEFVSETLKNRYGIEIQTRYILNELAKKLDNDYKQIVEAQITYDVFLTSRTNIFMWLDKFCNHYNTKNFICKLRKCKSWEEVMLLKNNFIELAKGIELKIQGHNSLVESNKCFGYYAYILFLANLGICAIIDDLYNELELKSKGPRPKFDYFNDGLPLTTIPIENNDVIKLNEKYDAVKENTIDVFNEISKECEDSYYKRGSLHSSILSNSKYLAIITACVRTELLSEQMSKNKFRKTFREYIHITELIALALYEADVNIDNEDYIKLATFKEEYSKKIDNAQTADEAMKIFEDNFEEFNHISENFKKGILDFGDNLLTIVGMLDLKLLAPIDVVSLYMHINEYRVLRHHMLKVRELAAHALEERLSYEIELASCLFLKLEDRLKELKKTANTNSTANVSIKSINKKIVKYKNIFDFKTLNKIAEQAGFKKVRQKGDHGIFKSIDGDVVVIPQGRSIGKGLSCKIQKNIMKSSEQQEMVAVC